MTAAAELYIITAFCRYHDGAHKKPYEEQGTVNDLNRAGWTLEDVENGKAAGMCPECAMSDAEG